MSEGCMIFDINKIKAVKETIDNAYNPKDLYILGILSLSEDYTDMKTLNARIKSTFGDNFSNPDSLLLLLKRLLKYKLIVSKLSNLANNDEVVKANSYKVLLSNKDLDLVEVDSTLVSQFYELSNEQYAFKMYLLLKYYAKASGKPNVSIIKQSDIADELGVDVARVVSIYKILKKLKLIRQTGSEKRVKIYEIN